jgi:hypothetical protein
MMMVVVIQLMLLQVEQVDHPSLGQETRINAAMELDFGPT